MVFDIVCVKPIFILFGSMQAEDMQQQIIRETFHLVSKRDDNVCNFLEGGRQVLVAISHLHMIYWVGLYSAVFALEGLAAR